MSVLLETIIPPPEEVPTTTGPYTVEDFYRLVDDGVKADLLDGWIYVSSPDTDENDDLGGFIYFLVRGYAETRGLGKPYGSRFCFRLTPRNSPEPDISFVRKERLDTVDRLGGNEAPDLAVEVVARDSRRRDYRTKFDLYEQSGVHEYWILDPLKREAHFYCLQESRFVEVEPEDGVFRSEVLLGFWLRVDWLFGSPRPLALPCLQQILAGEP